jgi:large subunit ribosomal protein L31
MKTGIHPDYRVITFACACGNTFQAGSTNAEDIRVEICANCHPLYTGKSNLIDTAGRLDKFQERQKKAVELREAAANRAAGKTPKATAESK